MAKKLNDLSALGAFAYSTNKDFEFDNGEEEQETLPNNKQQLEAIFSNKGRGGKTVTIIRGFVGTEEDLKNLGKLLKNKCGVGGSIKDGEIIIQGKHRDKIMEILTKDGYKVKRVGG
ncbi:translation initiation factor [Wenyingzhuangia sp. 2_MG-2023]|uniref:translation initiation factor n=1 Tax=Wenyingzhuangia sp. 2_MG-2023 TaxID=3062639 RepID=UPI0026E1B3DF|nr:translation initiation factor [Wenyingzhuangia sp. 2_MG-2023]MDO6738312.1 translation initiation factor [Wenyingzhuangia sp. 2_MG-2023]